MQGKVSSHRFNNNWHWPSVPSQPSPLPGDVQKQQQAHPPMDLVGHSRVRHSLQTAWQDMGKSAGFPSDGHQDMWDCSPLIWAGTQRWHQTHRANLPWTGPSRRVWEKPPPEPWHRNLPGALMLVSCEFEEGDKLWGIFFYLFFFFFLLLFDINPLPPCPNIHNVDASQLPPHQKHFVPKLWWSHPRPTPLAVREDHR